jgi:D-beta-D-heptose 7-phosphate kinase/D-beta-D-heptose 1-phosphate adenosyltransferase
MIPMPPEPFEIAQPAGWSGAPVLVAGDLMLDTYLRGHASRISPEAPVPVLEVREEWNMPGGAANVAANIAALGGKPFLCGITGDDEAAQLLRGGAIALGIDCGAVLSDPSLPTTRKTRLMGGRQQLLRVDREQARPASDSVMAALIARAEELAAGTAAIIISDYAKGVVTEALVDALRKAARRSAIPLLVDPKPVHAAWFTGLTLLAPNAAEAEQMCIRLGLPHDSIEVTGAALARRLESNLLITLGEEGMALFEAGLPMLHLPTRAREVYDVAGAGDTVMAALALAAASGVALPDSARIANRAAGIVVQKVGTATVTASELFAAL